MGENNACREQREQALPPIILPEGFNYIAAFLTFSCNLKCSYCINRFGDLRPTRRMMTGAEWARGLNRIVSRPDLPVTLQGGEPTLHGDFFRIVSGIRSDLNIDLLTNLKTDIDRFMGEVAPGRMKRSAPYASIRVSYHPETMEIEPLAANVLRMLRAGYSIGIWGVEQPGRAADISHARAYCLPLGIDFRTKEFLGEHEGMLYGRYKYPDACSRTARKTVLCRTTELLIGPGGDVYRCHSDLYKGRAPVGHILYPAFALDAGFRPCDSYGYCNPCDIKVKTNRFQQHGHTSVEVRFPGTGIGKE